MKLILACIYSYSAGFNTLEKAYFIPELPQYLSIRSDDVINENLKFIKY